MDFTLITLSGNRRATKLMQDLDVFQPGKIVAHRNAYSVHSSAGYSGLENRVKEFLEAKGDIVAAVFVVLPDGKAATETAYIDRTVKVISDGFSWYLFQEFLVRYGLDVVCENPLTSPIPPKYCQNDQVP